MKNLICLFPLFIVGCTDNLLEFKNKDSQREIISTYIKCLGKEDLPLKDKLTRLKDTTALVATDKVTLKEDLDKVGEFLYQRHKKGSLSISDWDKAAEILENKPKIDFEGISFFELKVYGSEEDIKAFEEKVLDSEYSNIYKAYDLYDRDPMVWPDYKTEMANFSLNFPELDFILMHTGTSWDYMERSFYKNGRSRVILGQITFRDGGINILK